MDEGLYMKKLMIFAVLAVLVALLPLVGNRVVKNTIEDRMEILSQNGLKAKLQKEERGYLKTELHYLITVADEEKFVAYLQNFASKKLPPYTQSLLDGAVFAVDIRYSNIPLSEKISIDLYPKKLSDDTLEELQKSDPAIYAFVSQILQKKALLYHIEYDVTSGEFRGSMKDFNEHFTTKKDENVSIVWRGVEAVGKGMLLAPDMLRTKVKSFHVTMEESRNALDVEIEDLLATTSFESHTTYTTTSKIASAAISLHTVVMDPATAAQKFQKLQFSVKNLAMNASMDTQGKDAEFYAKLSLDELLLVQNVKQFVLKGINFDASLSGVEKENFMKLQQLLEQSSQTQQLTPQMEQELQDSLVKIFAHGFHLNIADLSLQKIKAGNAKEEIEGFSIVLRADLASDPTFVQNYQRHPEVLMKNISIDTKMKFSKNFYALLNELYPVDLMFAAYKKEQGEDVLFHIEFKNGITTINGKRLQ